MELYTEYYILSNRVLNIDEIIFLKPVEGWVTNIHITL
jgi:hypothetical protein